MIPPGQYHVYAIGSQECMRSIAKSVLRPSKDAWEVRQLCRACCWRTACPLHARTLRILCNHDVAMECRNIWRTIWAPAT